VCWPGRRADSLATSQGSQLIRQGYKTPRNTNRKLFPLCVHLENKNTDSGCFKKGCWGGHVEQDGQKPRGREMSFLWAVWQHCQCPDCMEIDEWWMRNDLEGSHRCQIGELSLRLPAGNKEIQGNFSQVSRCPCWDSNRDTPKPLPLDQAAR
jgi:hypothetical protein